MPNTLMETLVADLIDLSNRIVEKQSELAAEYNNLRDLVENIQKKSDANDKDMNGDGNFVGLQEQIRSCTKNIADHSKILTEAQKQLTQLEKLKNRQATQWWILSTIGLAILGAIGKGIVDWLFPGKHLG